MRDNWRLIVFALCVLALALIVVDVYYTVLFGVTNWSLLGLFIGAYIICWYAARTLWFWLGGDCAHG